MVETKADPAVGGHLTPKTYVGQSIDGTPFVRYNKNNDFNNHSSSNFSKLTLNSEPTDGNHAATKLMFFPHLKTIEIDFKIRMQHLLNTQTKVENTYNNGM